MNFIDGGIKSIFLIFSTLWLTVTAAEIVELPKNVLVVDGKHILDKDDAEALLTVKFGKEIKTVSAETQREYLKRELMSRAQDLCVIELMEQVGIEPSPEQTRNYLIANNAKLPTAERHLENDITRLSHDKKIQFKIAANIWLEREFDNKTAVSNEELQRFYSANLSMFRVEENRRVALIAMKRSPKNDALTEKITAQLLQGENFELLNSKYNELSGTQLELLAAENSIKNAAEKLMPDGATATFLLLPDYAVIVKLAEYSPQRLLSFEESKKTLEKSLRDLKVRTKVNAAIAAEMKKHKIEINLGDTEK